jgi:hypothetical protein
VAWARPEECFCGGRCAIAALFLAGPVHAATADRETAGRLDMVRTIEVIARESSGGAAPTTLDAGVLEAMRRAPRHTFVPAAQRELAYTNRPLPIGYGQTISQPYIVALMTDLLRNRRGSAGSQPTRRWRETDSNPRSPAGGTTVSSSNPRPSDAKRVR